MEQKKVGVLLGSPEERDAIHIAIAPVVANEYLEPGERIGFAAPGSYEVVGRTDKADGSMDIGIVDPFLNSRVKPGERFWMFLYPQTITSLRHEWVHPAFQEVVGTSRSKQYFESMAQAKAEIAGIAASMGGDGGGSHYGPAREMTYSRLMKAADEFLKSGDCEVQLGQDTWRDDFPTKRFWKLYEIVTGEEVPEDKIDNFFSCSC